MVGRRVLTQEDRAEVSDWVRLPANIARVLRRASQRVSSGSASTALPMLQRASTDLHGNSPSNRLCGLWKAIAWSIGMSHMQGTWRHVPILLLFALPNSSCEQERVPGRPRIRAHPAERRVRVQHLRAVLCQATAVPPRSAVQLRYLRSMLPKGIGVRGGETSPTVMLQLHIVYRSVFGRLIVYTMLRNTTNQSQFEAHLLTHILNQLHLHPQVGPLKVLLYQRIHPAREYVMCVTYSVSSVISL